MDVTAFYMESRNQSPQLHKKFIYDTINWKFQRTNSTGSRFTIYQQQTVFKKESGAPA